MPPPTRPATISELASAAAESHAPPGRDLKYYLRLAEQHRKAGLAYAARASAAGGSNTGSRSGAGNAEAMALDMERAFIELARAGTLVVETIPTHRDYAGELTGEQKANLTANGHDILENLGKLKGILVDRYERYTKSPAANSEAAKDAVPAFRAAAAAPPPTRQASTASAHARQQAHQQVHQQAQQLTAAEAARWRAQREQAAARDAEAGFPTYPGPASRGYAASIASGSASGSTSSLGGGSSGDYGTGGGSGGYKGGGQGQQPTYLSSASQAAVAAAARAAAAGGSSSAASSYASPASGSSGAFATSALSASSASGPVPLAVPVSLAGSSSTTSSTGGGLAAVPPSFGRPNPSPYGDESRKGRDSGQGGGYTYPSSAGVSFPTPSISVAAPSPSLSSTSHPTTATSPHSTSPATSSPTYNSPSHPVYPSPASTYSGSSYAPGGGGRGGAPYTPAPGPMPLRPPAAQQEEWESDWASSPSVSAAASDAEDGPHPSISYPSPHGRPSTGGSTGRPADDVTASMKRLNVAPDAHTHIDGLPTPSRAHVAYPALARNMSTHQRTQGYIPGPGAWGAPAVPLLPQSQAQDENIAGVGASAWQMYGTGTTSTTLAQAQAAIGAARAAANAPGGVAGYSTAFSPPPLPIKLHSRPEPAPAPVPSSSRPPPQSQSQPRVEREPSRRHGSTDDTPRRNGKPKLRTVMLPQATLPRFLAIASGNTARNLETCGLLLGREVVVGGGRDPTSSSPRTRYVVETLLIPKQHATSDTCTMDEEEGVLGFTEERGLITLGWIHTHPSQSCFMSSVDLHTHASFQCMLPESFAVVCAPKSDPSFGIFRLTDPPGLETVLKCTAKQAFHPHPDVPIYTDADKGHVQMRDAALEIVDLR
ncbi:MPN domain-containing protein [Mycena sanguinolenta]|uniref:MPN domain-containing protein n=1 Tax=Mycena sanguinolenta TaxID=230812 RepID=A0A8H6ZG20_9AGAR|nr:MPN domain-containing protein [Mycena sanguinolenta]